jgi:hypothetical protein
LCCTKYKIACAYLSTETDWPIVHQIDATAMTILKMNPAGRINGETTARRQVHAAKMEETALFVQQIRKTPPAIARAHRIEKV